MAVVDRTATISNCLFKANRIPGFGAGVAAFTADGTKILNCTFTENAAGSNGGAIYNEESTGLLISDCTFLKNSANDSGGAIYNVKGSVTVTECLFQTNRAGTGMFGVAGAILNEEATPPSPTAPSQRMRPAWGGIFNYASDVRIEGCLFAECGANSSGGGGVYNNGGSVEINSCLFQENVVSDQGGAIMTTGAERDHQLHPVEKSRRQRRRHLHRHQPGTGAAANPQFINCTIFGNTVACGAAPCTVRTRPRRSPIASSGGIRRDGTGHLHRGRVVGRSAGGTLL